MRTALFNALSGLQTGLTRFNQRASDVANATTTGYRARRVDVATGPGGAPRVAGTALSTTSGGYLVTENSLDAGIEGDSFFAVNRPDGSTAYTRVGQFQLDSEGRLVTGDGQAVQGVAGDIQVPAGATQLGIDRNGQVSAQLNGETVVVGQLQSVRFNNPAALESVGNNQFVATSASGEPQLGEFGAAGFGVVQPGALEMSNVDLPGSIVGTMMDQRYLEMQLGMVRVADEIAEETVNLKRGN